MVIAWFGTVSIGMILARYFKDAWNNRLLCGVKIWFAVGVFESFVAAPIQLVCPTVPSRLNAYQHLSDVHRSD